MKKPPRITQFEIMRSAAFAARCADTRHGWYFHLRSRNGKISLQSEMYPSKAHCRRAIIRLVNVISAEPPIVEN